MGKYEELGDAVAQNPEEIEASDRIGSDSESFSDEMPSTQGVTPMTGDQSLDEQLSQAMADEEAEEAKVQGDDGHEELSGGTQEDVAEELDELSDGQMGEATPAQGPGEAPSSETYVESSTAQDLFEVEGFDPQTTEFADEQESTHVHSFRSVDTQSVFDPHGLSLPTGASLTNANRLATRSATTDQKTMTLRKASPRLTDAIASLISSRE
jgi:hypothetical protein